MSPARLPHRFVLHSGVCLCVLLLLLLLGSGIAAAAAAKTVEVDYQKAADQCHRLLRSPSLADEREDWLEEIEKLERIYRQEPQHRIAPACLKHGFSRI